MKFSPFQRFASALALLCLATPPLHAQDIPTPYVAQPVNNVSVGAGTISTVLKLKKTFGLNGVSGPLVRFTTTLGTIDVELLQSAAPQTVATFLGYAETAGDNTSGTPSYTNTLLQRAVPSFIVQGGGFYVDASGAINQITGRPSIASEAGISNTRGTLAMALSTGPDSGTGDFFFNVADNSAALDGTADGGPFTVFGRVVGSLSTLDAIEALPQRDFSASLGGSFTNVPLVNFDGSQPATVQNLVYTNTVTPIAIVPKKAGDASILSLKVNNSNPDLVTATLSGIKLTLTYAPNATGTSTIKVKATNPANGTTSKAKFTVTVQ